MTNPRYWQPNGEPTYINSVVAEQVIKEVGSLPEGLSVLGSIPESVEWPADLVRSAESGSHTGQLLPMPVPVDYLTPLIAALSAQTEAINRLAQSNEMLVQAMAQDGQMDEAEPVGYLNSRSTGVK